MKALMRSAAFATIVLALFLGACAKRPVVPAVSAPAPAAPPPVVVAPPPPKPAPAPAPPPPPVVVAPAPPPPTAAPAPPPPPPPPPKEFTSNPGVKTIHFDFDKSDIRPGDAKILDSNAAWLKDNPNYLVLIEGHTDERGTNEYNLALGDRRAKAAMNYLVAQGVRADRISVISYGEERPLCKEQTEACWARNRRDDFLVKER
jgi:peptidoglycan-associated lipoprotein